MQSQKAEPSFFVRLKMNPTEQERQDYERIKNAHRKILDTLEHESSKKLCKLTPLYETKLMEIVEFPHRAGIKLEEKAAHVMAEVVLFNMAEYNKLGAKPGERRKIYLLLKDLGVREEDIMIDTITSKLPYDEKRKGIICVREGNEFKSPEAVAYAKLYEAYIKNIKQQTP